MQDIKLSIENCLGFVSEDAVKAFEAQVKSSAETLEAGTGLGNDFLGWLHLPSSITPEFLDDIQETANYLRENCEVVVVAGIGGSYLGAKAVIDSLSNSFEWLQPNKPVMVYAGNNIGEVGDSLSLFEICRIPEQLHPVGLKFLCVHVHLSFIVDFSQIS